MHIANSSHQLCINLLWGLNLIEKTNKESEDPVGRLLGWRMETAVAAAVVCVEGILMKKTKRNLAYNLRLPLAGVTLGDYATYSISIIKIQIKKTGQPLTYLLHYLKHSLWCGLCR